MTTPPIVADGDQPGPAADATSLPRRRFQFSLATLLWLTTVVASLGALWATYREVLRGRIELKTARDEVAMYRDEMGYLVVSDPTKIYARSVRGRILDQHSYVLPEEDRKWWWRMYLPESSKFALCIATSGIPAKGFPYPLHQVEMKPGENLVEASAKIDRENRCQLAIKVGENGYGFTMPGPYNAEQNCMSAEEQSVADPKSGVVLLQFRKWKSPEVNRNVVTTDPQPCDGLMIWIEEAK